MPHTIAIEAHIDAALQARAAEILHGEGLTLADAVTILLPRTAQQGTFPLDRNTDAAYDTWVRTKLQEALDDSTPDTSNEVVLAHFRQRKANLLRRAG